MSHSLNDTKDQLTEQMLGFLWRQWTAVGVSGTARMDAHWVIDPEALLLISTEFARYDSRLFDGMLDWLIQHGNLINLKRVFRMRKHYALGNPDVLLAISRKLQKRTANIKWKSVTKTSLNHHKDSEDSNASPSAGFISLFPKVPFSSEAISDADIDFQENGYYRPHFEARGLSQAPSPELSCNLIFKMRAFFGCNTRAEIMAWLLTHPSGHPAKIARDTHYFNKSIQATLNEMAGSGHVYVFRANREKNFRILKEEWSFFYGSSQSNAVPPAWINWAELFAAFQLVHSILSKYSNQESSDLFIASELRTNFNKATIPLDFTTACNKTGTDFLQALIKDFDRLFRW